MAKALISITEAAELIDVSTATAYRMARADQLPIIRIGGDGAMRVITSQLADMYGVVPE